MLERLRMGASVAYCSQAMTRPSDPRVLTGGCQCGSVRYEIHGAPEQIYVCHCLECRKQSASAFGISVIVRSADLKFKGELRRWTRPTDSGNTLACNFCPICGSRVMHGDPERDETVSIKGGSVDGGVSLEGAQHLWVSRKLPGVVIPPGARTFDQEPD